MRDGTRLAMLEMIRGGITCFNDMYYFPDVVAGLAVEHHLRATVGMIVIEQPTPWAATTEEYFSKGLAVARPVPRSSTGANDFRAACTLYA